MIEASWHRTLAVLEFLFVLPVGGLNCDGPESPPFSWSGQGFSAGSLASVGTPERLCEGPHLEIEVNFPII